MKERSGVSKQPAEKHPPRPFSEFRETGVLWALNRMVFHPRGFALAIHLDDEGNAEGWTLLGDGSEPWTFAEEDAEFEAFKAFLEGAAK